MARKRRKPPVRQAGPRLRPELRPRPAAQDDDDTVDEPVTVDEEDPRDAHGTSVGILLAVGVVVGAIVTFLTPWNLLIGAGVGGLVGAIVGIVIDRRRGRALVGQE